MKYKNTNFGGWILANQDKDGNPDFNDMWFMEGDRFEELYETEVYVD